MARRRAEERAAEARLGVGVAAADHHRHDLPARLGLGLLDRPGHPGPLRLVEEPVDLHGASYQLPDAPPPEKPPPPPPQLPPPPPPPEAPAAEAAAADERPAAAPEAAAAAGG